MPVALRAHLLLPDGRRALPPHRGRIRIRSKDGDLTWLEPAVAERLIRSEAGKPAADDTDGHFTEPASSPWTK